MIRHPKQTEHESSMHKMMKQSLLSQSGGNLRIFDKSYGWTWHLATLASGKPCHMRQRKSAIRGHDLTRMRSRYKHAEHGTI